MSSYGANRTNVDFRSLFSFIRAYGIISIFFYHYNHFIFNDPFNAFRKGAVQSVFFSIEGSRDFLLAISQAIFPFGGKAYALFIIASGFGLYFSYLRNRSTWTAYFRRRALRILPLYWFALFIIYCFYHGTISAESLICHVFLVQTYTGYYLDFGALWFIGYIFQLYLVFPFLVKAFTKSYVKWSLLIASFFITPLVAAAIHAVGYEPVDKLPTLYLPLFISGMLIAESCHRGTSLHYRISSSSWFLISITGLAVMLYLTNTFISLGYIAVNVIFIFSLPVLMNFYRIAGMARPALVVVKCVAFSSYVIFLTHQLIFEQILRYSDTKQVIDYKILTRALKNADTKQFIEVKILPVGGYYFENIERLVVYGILIFLFTLLISYITQRLYDLALSRLKQMVPSRR